MNKRIPINSYGICCASLTMVLLGLLVSFGVESVLKELFRLA